MRSTRYRRAAGQYICWFLRAYALVSSYLGLQPFDSDYPHSLARADAWENPGIALVHHFGTGRAGIRSARELRFIQASAPSATTQVQTHRGPPRRAGSAGYACPFCTEISPFKPPAVSSSTVSRVLRYCFPSTQKQYSANHGITQQGLVIETQRPRTKP